MDVTRLTTPELIQQNLGEPDARRDGETRSLGRTEFGSLVVLKTQRPTVCFGDWWALRFAGLKEGCASPKERKTFGVT